jgi:hypothetical protein
MPPMQGQPGAFIGRSSAAATFMSSPRFKSSAVYSC